MTDPATARVLDWVKRHAHPTAPALFSLSREDARRLVEHVAALEATARVTMWREGEGAAIAREWAKVSAGPSVTFYAIDERRGLYGEPRGDDLR